MGEDRLAVASHSTGRHRDDRNILEVRIASNRLGDIKPGDERHADVQKDDPTTLPVGSLLPVP